MAETLLNNSGPDKTSAICYAVGWTQHTYGVQMIGTAATLQLLLGNIGRPGGGIMALRGHATIQGSTDVPTLYHSIHGYMTAPTVLKPHNTVEEYLKAETLPTGYWANTPKFFVSYLKSMYGDAATAENDFGFAWHPAHLRRPLAHADDDRHERGSREGHVRHGAEPGRRRPERPLQRRRWASSTGWWSRTTSRRRRPPSGTRRRRCMDGSITHRGHPDRGLLLPLRPGRGDGRQLHQHAAPDQVAPQGGRPARRLPAPTSGSPITSASG